MSRRKPKVAEQQQGIVPVPPAMELLTLNLPARQEDLLKVDAATDELQLMLPDIVIEDDATYGVADELLTQGVQLLDACKLLRTSVTGPVYGEIRKVEAEFKPRVVRLETWIIEVKKRIGGYRLQLAQAESEARAAAAEAAQEGDAEALVENLNAADALAQKPIDTGARVAVRWTVKRINPDMLPDEWWCPDEARIQEVALAHRGAVDDPPVIPGVTFEPVANVSARH